MKIAWYSWEPGVFNVEKTSGGGARWTRFLFDHLFAAGHKIMWGYTKEQPEGCERFPLEEVDLAFFAWRWTLPNKPAYKERNELRALQMKLVPWYMQHETPIIVHNEDMKVSPAEHYRLYSMPRTYLSIPALYPSSSEYSLIFPNPYRKQAVVPVEKKRGVVYVGNNYERYEQAKRLLAGVQSERVTIYGNWLEASPTRTDPERVKRDFPNVKFPGRIPQSDVPGVTKKALVTVHLSKPEYCRVGFVTIRWAEAAMAGTVALFPREWVGMSYYSDETRDICSVNSAKDVELACEALKSPAVYKRVLQDQRNFVVEHMTYMKWITMFERTQR